MDFTGPDGIRPPARRGTMLRCGVSALAVCTMAAAPAYAQTADASSQADSLKAPVLMAQAGTTDQTKSVSNDESRAAGRSGRRHHRHRHPAEPAQRAADQAQFRHGRRRDHRAGHRRSPRPFGDRSAAARPRRLDQPLRRQPAIPTTSRSKARASSSAASPSSAPNSTAATPSRPASTARRSTSRTCRPSCSARSKCTRKRPPTGSRAACPARST